MISHNPDVVWDQMETRHRRGAGAVAHVCRLL